MSCRLQGDDKAVKGSSSFNSSQDGQPFYLVNADAKAMFDKEKAKVVADADKNWPSVMGKAVMKMK